MRRILIHFGLLLTLLIIQHSSMAYHIVGGEMEFITIEAGVYRFNLIQYRDEVQQDNDQIVPQYDVYMFSNRDNRQVLVFTVLDPVRTTVEYTVPECESDQLKTSRVIWSTELRLNPNEFDDPEGYYFVWERCCRNAAVKNFNVNTSGENGTGMKYILEIPPLWKNGKPYINSSPILLKPLSDYACIDQLYYTSFTGTDLDGDSLVYKLVTPLNSSASGALPIPQPKPNAPLTFADGYGPGNVIPGNPALRISNRGLLTVKPFSTGLYLFSVMVEEYRDGVLHGKLQRDFQMLVIDGCDPPDPPVVGVKIPGRDDFNAEIDTLKYTLTDDKCFDFFVTNIQAGDHISLRAEPVNFEGNINDIFKINFATISPGQDTLMVQVCAPGCPPLGNKPFIIDLIAGDNACPLPQLDTARIILQVEPPPNEFPTLNTISSGYQVAEGTIFALNLQSLDADSDLVDMRLVMSGDLEIADYGFDLVIQSTMPGQTDALLTWNTNCSIYNFTQQNQFQLGIVIDDQDICEQENPNITWLDMEVVLPPNTQPQLSPLPDTLLVQAGELIAFDIKASDDDGDSLSLSLQAIGFNPSNFGLFFETRKGLGEINTRFSWDISCTRLDAEGGNFFPLKFYVEDRDKCNVLNSDSVSLVVAVNVPFNTQPDFEPQADTVLEVNTPVSIPISAFDFDESDSITLELSRIIRLPNSPSLSFESVTGKGSVTGMLEWTPECDLLDQGETSRMTTLAFLVYDNGCPIQKLDTMSVVFEVRETREAFLGFTPPNVFTPNGDGKNDVFSLTGSPVPNYNLPPNNCDDSFEVIQIFDRTGNVVFESTSRDFIWDGQQTPSGVYYYLIKYSKTNYNGFLQVLR